MLLAKVSAFLHSQFPMPSLQFCPRLFTLQRGRLMIVHVYLNVVLVLIALTKRRVTEAV